MNSALDPRRYASGEAFRMAVERRLREIAPHDTRRLDKLRIQFVIARLLTRFELSQPGEWVAKGGTSLLARLEGRCRLSRDLDIVRYDLLGAGNSGLSQAIDIDGGDRISYSIVRSAPFLQEDLVGIRFRLLATIDDREFASFGVDIVESESLNGRVEPVIPYSPITLVGVPAARILLYPVEDHVADKVAAMGKVRRHGEHLLTSTRYRDVADLAIIATTLPATASALQAALRATHRHWAIETFAETGLRALGPEWPARYVETVRADPDVARRWPTLDAALAAAKPLVDPALHDRAVGIWDPTKGQWCDSTEG